MTAKKTKKKKASPAAKNKSPAGAGRPTKCTEALTKEIAELIQVGTPVRLVTELVGIDFQTYANWIKWGSISDEELEKVGKPKSWPSDLSPYRRFFDCFTEASKIFVKNTMRFMSKSPDWRARKFVLQVRFKDHFQETQQIEITNKDSKPEDLTPEQLHKKLLESGKLKR